MIDSTQTRRIGSQRIIEASEGKRTEVLTVQHRSLAEKAFSMPPPILSGGQSLTFRANFTADDADWFSLASAAERISWRDIGDNPSSDTS